VTPEEAASHAASAQYVWGKADTFSISVALVVCLFFLAVRRKHRSAQGFVTLLGTGLSLGPLLLILLDPVVQYFGLGTYSWAASIGLHPGDSLLELVIREGRAILWWGSGVALIYIVKDLF
jgi:hypothetical protein